MVDGKCKATVRIRTQNKNCLVLCRIFRFVYSCLSTPVLSTPVCLLPIGLLLLFSLLIKGFTVYHQGFTVISITVISCWNHQLLSCSHCIQEGTHSKQSSPTWLSFQKPNEEQDLHITTVSFNRIERLIGNA